MDKQWEPKIRDVGLIPSDSGAPGGKETGQRITHQIVPGGVFEQACAEWLKENAGILYHDRAGDDDVGAKLLKKKAASKTKYT